jgi:hypothetical protein
MRSTTAYPHERRKNHEGKSAHSQGLQFREILDLTGFDCENCEQGAINAEPSIGGFSHVPVPITWRRRNGSFSDWSPHAEFKELTGGGQNGQWLQKKYMSTQPLCSITDLSHTIKRGSQSPR